jgi:Secretion system C-terminal sorting domain
MKNFTAKFYLLILGLVFNSTIFGQTTNSCSVYDDFTNPALWNHPVLVSNLSDPLNYNTLSISGGNFVFGQSRDNNINYMTRTGLTISNTDFVADIDFNYNTNGIGAGGANHTVLALNAGTNPFYSDLSNIGGIPISLTPMSLSLTTPQKGISISYESDLDNAPTLFQFRVYLNDGLGLGSSITPAGLPVVIPGPLVPAGSSANYYIRLTRTTTTSGILEIFSNPARTILLAPASTFTIPATINSLNTVFIGTNERKFVDNMLTGSLDNLCITNNAPVVTPTLCGAVFDDFSNPALWAHPVLGTNLQDFSFLATMNVSGGEFYFGQSRDNAFNYLTRTGLTIDDNNFRADVDFKHTSNGIGAGGAGHTVLALNAGIEPFFNSPTLSLGGSPGSATPISVTRNTQKGIAVSFESINPSGPGNFFEFKVYLNDGAGLAGSVVQVGTSINVGPAIASGSNFYYIRLKRTGTTSGELKVYSDAARTILIGSSGVFTFPAAINTFNTVQFGTNEWQEADRMLTGSLDNLCIANLPLPPTCNVVSDDFSNATLWTHPVLPTAVSCPTVYSSTMNISLNKFNFGQSRDNNMNYFYRNVGAISNSGFLANIDFKHTTNGTSGGGAGHTLLALNDGTKPFFNETTSTGGAPCGGIPLTLTTPSIQNGIAVTFESDLAVAPNFFEFKVYLNLAGAITPAGTPINVGLANTQFFISLERTSITSGELRVYSDIARTILVGSSGTFPIPAGILGLNTVDIGTNEWQNHDRMLTGFLKNLCISNTSSLANVSNEIEKNVVKVYPNPTKNILNVSTIENIKSLELFDLNGRMIIKNENLESINIENLNSGIYLLKINTENGISSQRIIKE